MKKVIFKKTGEVNNETKSFPAILFRSNERGRKGFLIGNSPVEVSDTEYEFLKKKHGSDIVLITKKTKLPKPMEVIIKGSEKKYKKIEPKKKKSKSKKKKSRGE